MPTVDTTLRLVHSEDFTFDAIISLNGEPANLDGATLYLTAKWSYSDADADAIFQLTNDSGITVVNAASGSISCTIPASATSALPYFQLRLPYDLLVVTASNTRGFPLRGTLIVSPNITRT